MTETDFKKGDTVEVDNIYGHTHDNRVGAKGTITEVRGGGTAYYVRVENKENYRFGQTLVFYPNELKLVKPEPKFQVGAEVTFCMPDFEGWQGGAGIVRSVPNDYNIYYKVEIVTPPPTNNAQRPGNRVNLLPEWIEATPKSDTYGLSAKDEAWAQKNKKGEAVKHPAHYGGGDNPYEAIKVIEAWGLGFNLGNAAKYLARAGKKGNKVEDLNKLIQYVQFEIAKEEAK